MRREKPKSPLECPCGGDLVEMAVTEYSIDADPYTSEDWRTHYYRCGSCQKISQLWYNDKTGFDKVKPYNGLLTEEEIRAHANEGPEGLQILELNKTIEIHDELERKGRLTPEIERQMLFDLGVHSEEGLRNLTRSVKHPRPGVRPAYPSVWEYMVNEVIPMRIRGLKGKQRSRDQLYKIIFGRGVLGHSN
jgi:hypothetical protein